MIGQTSTILLPEQTILIMFIVILGYLARSFLAFSLGGLAVVMTMLSTYYPSADNLALMLAVVSLFTLIVDVFPSRQ